MRRVEAYGDDADQVGDLWLPTGSGPHPVAVLVHGGFWHPRWRRDLMDGLAADLVAHGVAVWNVEYRRAAWPAPGEDVAAAVDHVATFDLDLDAGNVVLVGHSAGGQLALWAAGRRDPVVRPVRVVGLAALTDLAAARAQRVGGRSVQRLLGDSPVAAASPVERLPLGVPQVLAHCTDDELVPVDQSRRYVAAARAAGDDANLLELPRGGHFALVDPASDAWSAVRARLPRQ